MFLLKLKHIFSTVCDNIQSEPTKIKLYGSKWLNENKIINYLNVFLLQPTKRFDWNFKLCYEKP